MSKETFLHKLDPRTKLLVIAAFTILVFIVDSLPVAAVQMIFYISLCLIGGVPLKKVFPHYAMLIALVALVIALQAIFGGGLFRGLMIGCRIMALVALMPILICTTDAHLIALGITRLGIHYRAAYIITAALNMIPLFEEDARVIMDARCLRGIQLTRRGQQLTRRGQQLTRRGQQSTRRGIQLTRLREYPAIVLPLMFKAMRQAQMAALAMDSRAFGAYPARTYVRTIKFLALDGAAFAAGITWCALAIAANCLLKGFPYAQ